MNLAFNYTHLDKVTIWEEALYQTASTLLYEKVLSATYLKDIVEQINKTGEYMAITHNTVFWHARPCDEAIRKNFIAYGHLDHPVPYFGKEIKHVFVFGAQTDKRHQELLKRLSVFVADAMTHPEYYQEEAMKKYFG